MKWNVSSSVITSDARMSLTVMRLVFVCFTYGLLTAAADVGVTKNGHAQVSSVPKATLPNGQPAEVKSNQNSASSQNSKSESNLPAKLEVATLECLEKDTECQKDRLGFDAIRMLHLLIDDDQNGNVDQSESDEFIRDELQYTDGFERHSLFHNNDKLISVEDLWKAWKHSTVYNWTVDDVVDWLERDVDLPHYSTVFRNYGIDGSVLPRLVNSTGALLVSLGVRNPVHKQKLSLKAMDTVLFGAPKKLHSYVKDIMLFLAILLAVGISWFAFLHYRYSQTQVKKMMKDLESLQKAEDALKKLSKELADVSDNNQLSLPLDKQEELRILRHNSIRRNSLRVKIAIPGGDKSPISLSREGSMYHRQEGDKKLKQEGERKLKQAEEEISTLREALTEAESRLEFQQQLESHWSVPGELQVWLQLTHEFEQLHYNAKRLAAEKQLLAARDGCDKIKRRNKAFFGSLRMAHSNSLDEIDQRILDARAALEEVKQDLQERLHRWHTIEILCGFPVISNPGLAALKQALNGDGAAGLRLPGSLLGSVPVDEADEDLPASEDSPEVSSIYNQIPERQRQQIFAWARRGRVNSLIRKKALANGYPCGTLPSVGKPLSFHKQPNLTDSTGSLSHVGKVSSSGSLGSGHVRSASRDGELQGTVASGGGTAGSVMFNLGENSPTDRTQSNTSMSPVSTSPTSTHPLTHVQNRSGYNQSMSYPPFSNYNMAASNSILPAVLSKAGSSGNLLSSNSIPRGAGHSLLKLYGAVSGHHLSNKAVSPSILAALNTSCDSADGRLMYNDAGEAGNHSILASNLGNHSLAGHCASPPGLSHSASMVAPSHQQTHTLNGQLDDSDVASLDSISRSQSQSTLNRGRPSKTLELDQISFDSLQDSRESLSAAVVAHKKSKKKSFLPSFLKSKGKQKTT